jgi:hypothetical protein
MEQPALNLRFGRAAITVGTKGAAEAIRRRPSRAGLNNKRLGGAVAAGSRRPEPAHKPRR